jgi:hypothetical protein
MSTHVSNSGGRTCRLALQWALLDSCPHWHTPTFEQKASQQQHTCLFVTVLCALDPSCVPVQTVCIKEDAVHLTPKGQEYYFNAVFDAIENKLPDIK